MSQYAGKPNRAVVFANWPHGLPDVNKDFRVEQSTIPELKEGEVLLKTLFLSVDPYMRGRMRDVKSYFPSFQIGKPLNGGAVGEVVESKDSNYAVGEVVVGLLEWQEYNVVNPGAVTDKLYGLNRLPPNLGLPYSTALGVLGMPGMTAYFGLLEVTNPKEGETVVVSGAAGAVGMLVGQIAKIKGCHVVGIAGGEQKVKYLKEIGFDETIDYKAHADLREPLAKACPKGVDVYFDNVGGEISDAVKEQMNRFGRISCCGAISTYNATEKVVGPRDEWLVITRSLKKEGFIVSQWGSRYPEAFFELLKWVTEGKLKYEETIREGLENTPKAFVEMLQGANLGKMVVKL